LVCSHFAARNCRELIERDKVSIESFPFWDQGGAIDSDEAVVITQNRNELQHLMWNYVGIVRSNKRLVRAKKRIAVLKEEINQYYWDFVITADLIELRNMVLIADLIVESAIQRKESRGVHYSLDYPRKLFTPKDTILKKEISQERKP
jgi:L-aspartate oxidase